MNFSRFLLQRNSLKGNIKKKRIFNSLANAEGNFEAPLQRRVFVESLERLHAQVSVAGVAPSGHEASAAAVAQERLQVLTALPV